MPAPFNLPDFLHGRSVEWERLEFKAGWNPQAVLHTICAFANDFHNLGGGYIIVGVEERDGRPVLPPAGLQPDELDAIQKEILNLGYHAIQPAYHPLIFPEVVDGRHILLIHAPGGQTRPYRARKDLTTAGKDWHYYIRKGSNTVRARDDDERELLGLAATVPFDDRINQRSTMDDLSRELIVGFLKEIGSALADGAPDIPIAELARQLQLVDGPPEACFPRNVGLLFFNPDPQRFFPATQIDVVWFPYDAAGDTFTEKIFRGPLHHMIREALDYIRRNYLSETVIKRPDRAESTRVENFPFAAVEELLANAIYHRSYEVREPVEVRITPRDLVILSHPGPDRSIRIDQLRAGRAVSRRYRNRRIGDFLKELNFTEGRSTGIPKVQRAMRENGSPPAEFEFDEDHTYFLVRLPVHPSATPPASGRSTPATGEVTAEVTAEVGRLLSILIEPAGRKELQDALGLKHDEHFRLAYLAPALAAGLIEMTIPDKPKSRLQKYRITAKGRSLRSSASQ